MRGFHIYLTDGSRLRRTVLVAQDAKFAELKASYFVEGTKWQIQSIVEIIGSGGTWANPLLRA